jgi:hypothetical protein
MHAALWWIGCFVALFFFSSCASSKVIVKPVRGLRFLDEYTIPSSEKFEGTKVGGLSGIDYDADRKLYYLICDDRADTAYMRFYTARISLTNEGISHVELVEATKLLNREGTAFHNRKENPLGVPDPEAIRYHAPTKQLFWSSEGERTVRNGALVLTDPAIFISKQNGEWVDTFPLPQNIHFSAGEKGPRNNGAFEGLSFSPDYKKLFVSLEEPLYEDGPRAGLFDSAGWIRILQYDTKTKKPEVQYAYPIDPVVQEPISEGLFTVNGVTDILALNHEELLVTERSFSTGRLNTNVRVYLVNLNGADNLAGVSSLKTGSFKPLQKRLLLDIDRLGRLVDNIEGATLGPRLPNGKRSLLFVADNNFHARQKNQLLLFEIE